MAANTIETELITHLTAAHALEQQGVRLLSTAEQLASDEQIAEIYQTHRLETEEHIRSLAERIAAHGAGGELESADTRSGIQAVEIRFGPQPSSATLAAATYAFENLEIAAYHLLGAIAERAGDRETVATAERILEQEEAAAEVLASTFDRALQVSIGEPPTSPAGHFHRS